MPLVNLTKSREILDCSFLRQTMCTPMLASAVLASIALVLALGFYLIDELSFLIPYCALLFRE
jgi:hypothetical protein